MSVLIYLGLLNIAASMGFVAWSETCCEGRATKGESRAVRGLSHGESEMLAGIVRYSDVKN